MTSLYHHTIALYYHDNLHMPYDIMAIMYDYVLHSTASQFENLLRRDDQVVVLQDLQLSKGEAPHDV